MLQAELIEEQKVSPPSLQVAMKNHVGKLQEPDESPGTPGEIVCRGCSWAGVHLICLMYTCIDQFLHVCQKE